MKQIFLLLLTIILFISSASAQSNIADEEKYLNLNWWGKYNDDYLKENLITVYKNNYDLKIADLKVKENEKIVKMQFSNELPFINFSADLSRDLQAPRQQFGDMTIPKYSQYNYILPLSAGYEIDIWGSNRLKTKSAKQQLEMVKEAKRAVYIALTSDFAADYFNLIKADKLLELQDEIIKIQEKIVSMVSDKYEIGLCTINEVLLEEKILTTLKEERNKHKLNQELLEESLKVYLVNSNDDIMRNTYDKTTLITGIPQEYAANIIENRPDFKQEEANIKRIGFDVKAAKRAFLPNFTIVGQLGLNAYHLGSLFHSNSQFLNLGILPSVDLLAGGRKIAFLKLKKYQYERALNSYKKTILQSIKEMNSGLYEYKTSMQNYNESKERLKKQNKIYSLAQEKKEIGSSSLLDLLYAKEERLIIEKEEVSNKINAIISSISLYKAAGGINLYEINNEPNL